MKGIVCISILFLSAIPVWGQESADPPEAGAGVDETADSIEVHTDEELKKALATVGMANVAAEKDWERRKSAKVAVFSSMVLPGLGQAYNGRKIKAGVFMGLFTYFASLAYVERQIALDYLDARDGAPTGSSEWANNDALYQSHRDFALDNAWWAGGVWFIGMLDAFVDAHLYDVRAVDPDVFKGSSGQKYAGLSFGL
jgi:hypothetical protein